MVWELTCKTYLPTGRYAVLYPCKLWQLELEGSKLISPTSLDWGSWHDIYEAFNEIVDDVEENYFNEPTQEQLQEAWLDRVRAGLDEDFAKHLAREFYFEDCILNEISIGNARKFLRWLDDKSRFFTYVGLKSGKKSVDLVEYHPLTNLESYLLEDKQALETVFFGK